MTRLLDDALLPTDREALRAEIAEAESLRLECLAEIRTLMERENPAQGIFFAAEIHEAKQRGMMLQYQRDLRIARLNRLDG